MNVARSADEAERQAKGEDLTSADAIYGTDEEEGEVSAEELFEEGVEFTTAEDDAAADEAAEEAEPEAADAEETGAA